QCVPGGCKASRCVVLGRADSFGYRRSLRPCTARFSLARNARPPLEEALVADLGRAALLLSLGLVAYALVGGSFAAWNRRRRLALSAQNALMAAFATTLVGAAVLLVACARRDLSFVYVAQHTSRSLPLGYALSAFWGGQEGSLLLWLLVLTGYSALA